MSFDEDIQEDNNNSSYTQLLFENIELKKEILKMKMKNLALTDQLKSLQSNYIEVLDKIVYQRDLIEAMRLKLYLKQIK